MKTIHIIALHLAFGGIEKAIVNMANLFVEKYDVEIICVYNMPNSPAYKLDERVRVKYLLDDIPNIKEWKDAVSNRKALRILKESVRSVSILAGKRLSVIREILNIKDGIIITTRHEDNLLLSRFGREGVVKIAQLHHDHRFEKKYIEAFKKSYSNIDYFAVLTPKLKDEVSEMMKGTKTEVVCIPNFIDEFPENVDMAAKEKVVVAAGRLHAVKRFDLLIHIFASVHDTMPDWKLHIIGDGEEREKLKKYISDCRAEDYIILKGVMDARGVMSEMCAGSIYAMSSSSEGFPFVIVEAQSCCMPVVAFDVRVGPPFLIKDGEDGFLIRDNDEEGYANSLIALMRDEQLRKTMGLNARKNIGNFSREQISDLWFELLGE